MTISASMKSPCVNKPLVAAAYALFIAGALIVYHLIAQGEFSAVLTVSAIFQCLAFSLLGVQALSSDINGISVKSLNLDALALACRLSSTLFFEGYLPGDSTGDYLYQAFDVVSLLMVLCLIYNLMSKQEDRADAENLFPISPLVVGALILACLLHANLDDNRVFDTLWMCGAFIGAIAVLPQLWLMTHNKCCVPALTSHFVAVMALSRVLSGLYMWHAHTEIECDPWIGTFNHAGYAVLASHVVHLLLLGDFAYYYGKHVMTSGLQLPLPLPEMITV